MRVHSSPNVKDEGPSAQGGGSVPGGRRPGGRSGVQEVGEGSGAGWGVPSAGGRGKGRLPAGCLAQGPETVIQTQSRQDAKTQKGGNSKGPPLLFAFWRLC